MVEVHVNARLQPAHRHALFEDPVFAMLKLSHPACGMGSDIKRVLESTGAPRRSTVTVSETSEHVGVASAVSIWCSGLTEVDYNDADNVPCNRELDEIMARLTTDLGEDGSIVSWSIDTTASEIFVHGRESLLDSLVLSLANESRVLGVIPFA
jgi:hypothetical protein